MYELSTSPVPALLDTWVWPGKSWFLGVFRMSWLQYQQTLKTCIFSGLGGFSGADAGLTPLCHWAGSAPASSPQPGDNSEGTHPDHSSDSASFCTLTRGERRFGADVCCLTAVGGMIPEDGEREREWLWDSRIAKADNKKKSAHSRVLQQTLPFRKVKQSPG